MFVDFNILNQLGSPAINSNTFANRPAAGQTGRLFVSTDTFEIYRDNGTTWDLIGGPGTSTITGTGTATQVAYFTSSQAIGSSANLYWDNTAGALGINTNAPTAELDVHGVGVMLQLNETTGTSNSLLAFQRSGVGVWRIGDVYNSGSNYFELYNTVLGTTGLQLDGATNKAVWQSQQTYASGLARANYFDYNLSVAAGGSFSTPNAITALGASLDLTLAGSATIPSGARSGLDAYNSVSFTGAGTLTMTQGTQIRPYSNITAGWAFNGSATGTITHLAGLRVLFPDNSGSAVTITNNYGLLINDQTANTGTVTYTNRWGIYQEGTSDLNYFAANLLLGSTTNNGLKLQVTGQSYFSDNIGLNVTPSAWGSSYRVLEGGDNNNQGAVTFRTDINGVEIFANAYFNGTNDIYKYTGAAGLYRNTNGEHIWFNAPSGTAGNTISFTQAMILNASGNLGVGITNPLYRLDILESGATTAVNTFSMARITGSDAVANDLTLIGPNTSQVRIKFGDPEDATIGEVGYNHSTNTMRFNTNGSQRMIITSGGNLLIGTTTDAGQKLQVNGTSLFTSTMTANGNFNMNKITPTIQLKGTDFGNSGAVLQLLGWAGSYRNWQISVANLVGTTGLEFTPSTTDGGSTFSTTVVAFGSNGDISNSGGITTAAPTTGTAAKWKLGSRVAAAVVLDATQYIEVEVGGTFYKLAIVT
jgi:hypothetical protein